MLEIGRYSVDFGAYFSTGNTQKETIALSSATSEALA